MEFRVEIIEHLPELNILNLRDNSFQCKSSLQKWVIQLNNYAAKNDIKHYGNCLEKKNQSSKILGMLFDEMTFKKNSWLHNTTKRGYLIDAIVNFYPFLIRLILLACSGGKTILEINMN